MFTMNYNTRTFTDGERTLRYRIGHCGQALYLFEDETFRDHIAILPIADALDDEGRFLPDVMCHMVTCVMREHDRRNSQRAA